MESMLIPCLQLGQYCLTESLTIVVIVTTHFNLHTSIARKALVRRAKSSLGGVSIVTLSTELLLSFTIDTTYYCT